jgi:hypothetical protein
MGRWFFMTGLLSIILYGYVITAITLILKMIILRRKKMHKYVIIEQDGEGGAIITHVNKIENYHNVGNGIFIWLNEEDYYNMCQAGIGG